MVDNLAMQIPSSWHRYCLICWLRSLGKSPPKSENALESNSEKTAVVFYPTPGLCTLERTEDIDRKSTTYSLGLPLILRRNVVERTSYREIPPSSAQSVKVQHDGGTKTLAEILIDNSPKHHRTGKAEQQRPLAHGFHYMKENAGTQTTPNTELRSNTTDVHEVETPLPELPTPESYKQETSPVELPANEILPAATPPVPQPVIQSASPAPLLPTPHPRSPNTRKLLPLLAPPKRFSGDSSMKSGSIEISYVPSHPDGGEERDFPTPFRLYAYGGGEDVPAPLRISECFLLV